MAHRLLVLTAALVALGCPAVALADFGAEIQQLSFSGSAVVGEWINVNVKVKNLSTPDSGYGGDATFCITCNIDPPGFWNDFDQEKTGQSFGLYQTKTVAMPSFLLDDDGDWDLKCEVKDSGCGNSFASKTGYIPVELASCSSLGYPLGPCGGADNDGDCKDNYDEVWKCVDTGAINCWQLIDDCSSSEVCHDQLGSPAECIGAGHEDYCSALGDVGDACGHGESDCDTNGQCAGNLVCSGPVWPYSGMDGCCWPGEEWNGEVCLVNDCPALGYPLGECGSADSDGDCKDGFSEVWVCVDAGPLNCWEKTESCAGDEVCSDGFGSSATCVWPGHEDFCDAMADAGEGCGYGESDCDFNSECEGELVCSGPVWPNSGMDGCCWPGEEWDGDICLPNDCGALGYPLGECPMASAAGACSADFSEVRECVDAGPVNCWTLKEGCGAGVCYVSAWDGAASCVFDGDDAYCSAMKKAGSGCDHGQSDCDLNSDCLGELDCNGPVFPFQGNDGCCWPGEEWNGEICLVDDCGALGYPLGECDSASSDGECMQGFAEVWECVDAGPLNCWNQKQVCSAAGVCYDATMSAAVCVDPGHEDFCKAKKDAGSGCTLGQSDCDFDSECVGALVCAGPVWPFGGMDGCCNAEDEWDGEKCGDEPPPPDDCPDGCLGIGELVDEFDYPFTETISDSGLWKKQSHDWLCPLDETLVTAEDGMAVLKVPGGGGSCAQMDSTSNDFFYGAYRASIRTSPNSGLCGAFFYYGPNGESEIDVEILSKEQNLHRVHFVTHPSGEGECGTPAHKCVDMDVDPSADFHVYGFDLYPDKVLFFIDDVQVAEITENVPANPGTVIISNWTGNEWSGPAPADDSFMLVEWVEYVPFGLCEICSQCGNDMVTLNEECDGAFLNGATCELIGLPPGELSCTGQCGFDSAGCEGQAGCGDGACGPTEDCDTCPADCPGCCGNSSCEPDAEENCESCPADCGECQGSCGNGACDPGEHCVNCAQDCGECCGNGQCEPAYGEDCEECPADCEQCPPKCGNGACDGGESCQSCALDCGECCGNGQCEPNLGEDCEFCPEDCGECKDKCGNAACDAGENCANCPGDCGNCCGNGHCEPAFGENCGACAVDCGACPTTCGDGQCQEGTEGCQVCPGDCGTCCGNGKCEPGFGEDCIYCKWDCGECLDTCPNGQCDGEETCANCPDDCSSCCGNGLCESAFGESCGACPADCGACPATCKDGICQDGETCQACPSDCGACCGNEACETYFGEDCVYCPEDCGACGCDPDCTGKVCGDNGCGGFCAPGCAAGQTCSNGQCMAAPAVESGADVIGTDTPGFITLEEPNGSGGSKAGGCGMKPASGPAPLSIFMVLVLALGLYALRRRGHGI